MLQTMIFLSLFGLSTVTIGIEADINSSEILWKVSFGSSLLFLSVIAPLMLLRGVGLVGVVGLELTLMALGLPTYGHFWSTNMIPRER